MSTPEKDAVHDELYEKRRLEEQSRVRRKRLASKGFELLSGIAAMFAGVALSLSIVGFSSDSLLATDRGPALSDLQKDLEFQISALDQRLDTIDQIVGKADIESFSEERLRLLAEDNRERIDSLETILDVRPREIIEITRLRDDIDDLEVNMGASIAANLRETERAYNTVLALIGALLVAVVLMVVANFLRSNSS